MMYNRSQIMKRAWKLFKTGKSITFAECQHRAWLSEKAIPINAQRIEKAKASAGVMEAVNTWAGWQKAGFEVLHGSKALFGCELIYGSHGDGATYKARFFGESQVRPLEAA